MTEFLKQASLGGQSGESRIGSLSLVFLERMWKRYLGITDVVFFSAEDKLFIIDIFLLFFIHIYAAPNLDRLP